jgi:hypothetical protein
MSFYYNNFDYTTYQQQQDTSSNYQDAYNSNNLLYFNNEDISIAALDELPVFEYNNIILQDDNFSIATASDLYPQLSTPTPSLLSVGDMSMQQLTPNSTPSPQLTSIYHHQRNISFDSFFFAPDIPNSPPKRRVSSTSITEKRHICPVCNHR